MFETACDREREGREGREGGGRREGEGEEGGGGGREVRWEEGGRSEERRERERERVVATVGCSFSCLSCSHHLCRSQTAQ